MVAGASAENSKQKVRGLTALGVAFAGEHFEWFSKLRLVCVFLETTSSDLLEAVTLIDPELEHVPWRFPSRPLRFLGCWGLRGVSI